MPAGGSDDFVCPDVMGIDLNDLGEAWERLLDEAEDLPATEAVRRVEAFGRRLTAECSDEANRRHTILVRSRRRRSASSGGIARVASLAATHCERALARGALSTLTYEQIVSVLAAHQGVCTYCGTEEDKLTIDHVISLARGGSNEVDNIVGCCRSCNSSKHDGDVLDWLERRGLDVDAAFRRMDAARALRKRAA
jgi:5-methylcytosine-specific restriction endonuclease McrA